MLTAGSAAAENSSSELGSALGLSKRCADASLFSPRHSSSELGSALGLSKRFSEISTKDGLSQAFVHSLKKDSGGYVWIGTSCGLNRYDGYSFATYRYSESDSLSLSGNLVNCMAEDASGRLWVGTGNGLCRYDAASDSFVRYIHSPELDGSISGSYVKSIFVDSRNRLWVGVDGALNLYNEEKDCFTPIDCSSLLSKTRINDLKEDRRGTLWIATRDQGLIALNPETLSYVQYLHDAEDKYSLSSNYVSCLYEDESGQLWVGTWEHGLNIYDRRRDIFTNVTARSDGKTPNSNQIRCLAEDSSGCMWVGTSDGLSIYKPSTEEYSYCKRQNDVPGTLSYNIINCIMTDGSGAVWLGTHGGGVSFYHPAMGQYRIIDPKIETGRDFGYIGPMVEIDGCVWIGTEGGGLGCWNPSENRYVFHDIRGGGNGDSGSNIVRALCVDSDGKLWIGTYASGVTVYNPRNCRVEKHYDEDNGLNNSIINEISEAADGTIYVGSNSNEGLYRRKPGGDRFEKVTADYFGDKPEALPNQRDFPWIRSICQRSNGELWLGSLSSGVFVYRPGGSSEHYSVRNSELSSNSVSCIFEDSCGEMWVGTYGGGVNVINPATGSLRVLDSSTGLLNDNVCSIVEDRSGRIWLGTMAGLSVYDKEEKNFSTFSYSNGNFPIETLNLKSGLISKNGNIYFGGSNGIAEFSPESLFVGIAAPPVVITSPLVAEGKDLTLSYKDADFTIEFAALSYVNTANISYSYCLEGYDGGWSAMSDRRQATYTNLPSGDYVFKVRASDGRSDWDTAQTQLNIHILPPPWLSWWAWALYAVSFVAVSAALAVYVSMKIKRKNVERVLALERETKDRMHREQMNVFTNFSHELRTPLTLILDPLRNILANERLTEPLRKSLTLMQSNADRILTLVNQLMDYRRQDSGQMKFRPRCCDMLTFSKEMVDIFSEQARAKSISLGLKCSEESVPAVLDPFLMEKVFFNLLSNAVKNTPEGGSVTVGISYAAGKPGSSGKSILLQVSDSGPGIPEEDLDKVFAPFYRVDERKNGDLYGTGIGLHLTKSIVEMHRASVWAENRTEGGAVFNVLFSPGIDADSLPDGNSTAETAESAAVDGSLPRIVSVEPNEASEAVDSKKLRVLVVDDNADIRSYIAENLKSEYDVAEADCGTAGVTKAVSWQPNLVICDIIMPGMDGLEMLKQLKADSSTSHIPVILLTALSSTDQAKEGLRAGADDYVTKPFDMQLLKTRVDSLIENRLRLKENFLRDFSVEITGGDMNHTDRYFLSKAYDYVKEHLNDENLSIEGFGRSMHLSRTQLYRKIKSLTGLSPSVFVSTLRLKIAASLLTETNLSISEVAYKVGFSSPSYFTTSFRKLYGVSPKEYVNRKQ